MRGVYVHLPFCLRKCPYCAFFSVTGADDKMEQYVDRLIKEMKTYPSQAVETIYIGGGTPTALPAPLLVRLLEAILFHFPCEGEITIEANPATVSKDTISTLYKAGYNRISIGVQSLCDEELTLLGRLHTAKEAVAAIQDAAAAGFSNISADIIFGLPRQSVLSVKETTEKLISLPITHISTYSLSLEEGTPFCRYASSLPEESVEREMYYTIRDILTANGFVHYEISNFARPGFSAVHNTNYWRSGEYIGLGAGAHGYYEGIRYANVEDIDEYIKRANARETEVSLTETDKREEYYMLGLRMLEGVKDDGNPKIPLLLDAGLLAREGERVRLTNRGMDIANFVITELFT